MLLKFSLSLFYFSFWLISTNAQFSRTCRNLLSNDCILNSPDFASEVDNLCECDLHPVKTFNSQSAAPGIQCIRFSLPRTQQLFRCLAQPQTLKSADFYKDSWSTLPDFRNLTSLQVLRLRDLGLRDVNLKQLNVLQRLKKLELSNNKFKQLPKGLLDGLAGLEELVLHGNRMAGIERNQFASAATRLKKLTLSEMEFSSIPPNFFAIFPELEYLAITSEHFLFFI